MQDKSVLWRLDLRNALIQTESCRTTTQGGKGWIFQAIFLCGPEKTADLMASLCVTINYAFSEKEVGKTKISNV